MNTKRGSTMTNTEALLSQYGVSFSEARNFIYSNLDNPLTIYDTAAQFNVTYDILAELYGQEVTGAEVKNFFSSHSLPTNNNTPNTGQIAAVNLKDKLAALNAGELTSLNEALADFNSFYSLITEFNQDTSGQALPSLEGLGLETLFTTLLSTLTSEGISGVDLSGINVNLPNVNLDNVGAVLGSDADIIALTKALTGNDASSTLQDFITKLAGATDTILPPNLNEASLSGIPEIATNDFI
jgi:hypothetical protein